MIQDWNLTETNLSRLSNKKPEVAVIPIGAIEPHNLHLPEGQDFLHASWVAKQSCQLAWEKCQSVICLPAIPYGVDCNLMDFPLAIHVSQAVLDALLKEIILSLYKHGIKKILILNGHGGNDFTPFIRQIQCDYQVHVFLCNWWKVGSDQYSEIFEKPDDHAGEFETSVALALFPELVELQQAQKALTRPFRFEALNKGWIQTSRNFARLNYFCAAGDPAGASAEKGKKYLDLVCHRISNFLVELAQAEIDEVFPQSKI